MTYDDFVAAVTEAETIERRAQDMVRRTARLCIGRLHTTGGVPAYVLSALKRELQDWNIRTEKWGTR